MPIDQIDTNYLVTAADWNELVDALNEIEAGLKVLTKITLSGGSEPAVSAASKAAIYYDSALNELRASLNGGAFERLGAKKPYADPVVVGGTVFGF